MMRVLVTGSTGFVGRHLCESLARSGIIVRAALRSDRAVPEIVSERVVTNEISSRTDWSSALEGVDAVIHTAARVHVLKDAAINDSLYAEVNARGTLQLAKAAARAGVRRFVYLSSIKVNGAATDGRAFSANDTPHPCDSYSSSKWLAEQYLREASAGTGMEAVIVRSPLVYGPGVKANFLHLLRWVHAERPLPFGAIKNSRSLVSIWNLCDLLVDVLTNQLAPRRAWLVSDGDDLSTPELIFRIARAMGRSARLLSVPVGVLRLLGSLSGRRAEVERLCSSLVCDITTTRNELGWSPPVTVDESIARTVAWFLSSESFL
jgi:nucleoside-diphosphate-sugar epimerase